MINIDHPIGAAVWVIVDADVLPARVVRCYVECDDAGRAGARVVVKWPEPDRCHYDTFAEFVYAESEWASAKSQA